MGSYQQSVPEIVKPPRRDGRWIALCVAVFAAAAIPVVVFFRLRPEFRSHPFSFVDLVSVFVGLLWYWSRVLRDRAKLRTMEGRDQATIQLALEALYRGLLFAVLLTALSFSALHFIG